MASVEVVEIIFRNADDAERAARKMMERPPFGMCGLRWATMDADEPSEGASILHVWFTRRSLKRAVVDSLPEEIRHAVID